MAEMSARMTLELSLISVPDTQTKTKVIIILIRIITHKKENTGIRDSSGAGGTPEETPKPVVSSGYISREMAPMVAVGVKTHAKYKHKQKMSRVQGPQSKTEKPALVSSAVWLDTWQMRARHLQSSTA